MDDGIEEGEAQLPSHESGEAFGCHLRSKKLVRCMNVVYHCGYVLRASLDFKGDFLVSAVSRKYHQEFLVPEHMWTFLDKAVLAQTQDFF